MVSIFISKLKYCGPLLRSGWKVKSKDWIWSPNINIFSLPGTSVARGGFDCLFVTRVEEMEVLLRVSAIILKNPAVITLMMAKEKSPPVRVLYCVYEL
jgi:hypothetical protein